MKRAAAIVVTVALVLFSCLRTAATTVSVTVTPVSFSFPSGDPDSAPVVTGSTLTIKYSVKGGESTAVWVLSARAGDLMSGPNSISATNISWTASPTPPFVNGTLRDTDTTVATGQGNMWPAKTGYVTFSLQNLWTYRSGTYSNTITFTITSP